MIFSEDFLFIHVPKTAGMAISDALLKYLKGNVYYAVQAGHAGEPPEGVTVIEGRRHQRLSDVDQYFTEKGLPHRVDGFRYVMAMVRNPYEMEVSRFHYLRKGHAWDAGRAQEIALAGNFEQFCRESRWWFDFRDYYTVDGRVPDNLYLLRQESFVPTMKLSFADVLDDGFSLEEVNRSHRSSYREYFTPELERLIYCKYRWLFDKGFYPREVFSRSVVPSIPALEQGPR